MNLAEAKALLPEIRIVLELASQQWTDQYSLENGRGQICGQDPMTGEVYPIATLEKSIGSDDRQLMRRAPVYVRALLLLRDEAVDATPSGDLAFLTTEKGKPFSSAASFGNWFAKQCKLAGLPDVCRAHGLRKAGATIAADEGASAHELMAMFGWSRLAMAEIYTKETDKKRLARGASERLSNRM